MAHLPGTGHPLAVRGIRLGAAAAGIKREDRDDLLIIEADEGATAAAVFTRNAFCAAPVRLAREHLGSSPRWLLVNSGNANAGTGDQGLSDAMTTCRALADLVGADVRQVLPFSTGVIGEFLPVAKIEAALPAAVAALDEAGWERGARAIMTTDTRPKTASRACQIAGQTITVTGISKGAGMIHPNMATMLAFLATDARVNQSDLQAVLARATDKTFNCITIDGDTSTNDACVLLASGAAMAAPLELATPDFAHFEQAVFEVCAELAEAIVRDGEGATKLMRIQVQQARPKPSRFHPWSKPPFLPAIQTGAAFWRPSAVRVASNSISTGFPSGWVMYRLSSAGVAHRVIRKQRVPRSWPGTRFWCVSNLVGERPRKRC
jgi:glutamate N-acetyltransferase/amino-acid N-acetyltransferase